MHFLSPSFLDLSLAVSIALTPSPTALGPGPAIPQEVAAEIARMCFMVGEWRVDAKIRGASGYIEVIEGQFRDGRFIEINYGSDQQGAFIGRLVVSEMTDDHFVVRKDRLYDDRTVYPEIWVYEATRTGGASGC
jgi:hypothetical protein